MRVAAFGREFGHQFRGKEAGHVVLPEVANGAAGKSAGEPAKLNGPVLMVFWRQLRPLAVAGLRAGFLGGDGFLDCCLEVLPLHHRDRAGEALDDFGQRPLGDPGNSLTILKDRRRRGNFTPGGLVERVQLFKGGELRRTPVRASA